MSAPTRALVVGNWKMNLTAAQAAAYARSLLPLIGRAPDREVAVAPPSVALTAVAPILAASGVTLAAQNLFWEDEGAYTGEVSGVMLREAGVGYVIVGHSERRRLLDESDRVVALKVRAALRTGLRPILCVGEDEAERAAGRAQSVVRSQVALALEGIPAGEAARLQIAYEPVWAIGTGRAATTAQAAEMHAVVRNALEGAFGAAGRGVRVLYGGSVTAENIDALMSERGVDGVLVGGASLKAADFARITAFVRAA